ALDMLGKCHDKSDLTVGKGAGSGPVISVECRRPGSPWVMCLDLDGGDTDVWALDVRVVDEDDEPQASLSSVEVRARPSAEPRRPPGGQGSSSCQLAADARTCLSIGVRWPIQLGGQTDRTRPIEN